jgi:uncharacterized protein (TIGR00297 family)
MSGQILLGALFGLLIAIASYIVRFLTFSGSVATFILAVVVFGVGGWQWAVPMVAFFVLSSLLSKYGRARKERYDLLFEKSGTRDWAQVAANGCIAGAIVLASAAFPIYDFYPIYLGALAAATADTWGTEIGILSRGEPVSVLTFQRVSPGVSGAVSGNGSIGGAIGAAVIALAGYPWYMEFRTTLVVVAAGIVGSLADSMLGATLQAQFACRVCGKTTERRLHCGESTDLSRGIRWINNDVVNGVCALVGAVVAWGLMLLL